MAQQNSTISAPSDRTNHCPDWCSCTDHYAVAGDVLHGHEIEAAPGVTVEISQSDHCMAAGIYVNQRPDADLTAPDARRVAVALLQAADLADGRDGASLDATAAVVVEQAWPLARRVWALIDEQVAARR